MRGAAFSYDSSEDALRFSATMPLAISTSASPITLDDPTDNSVVATLRWEKLAFLYD